MYNQAQKKNLAMNYRGSKDVTVWPAKLQTLKHNYKADLHKAQWNKADLQVLLIL